MKSFFQFRKSDPSKESGPYQESLISVTKAGSIFTTAFFSLFTLFYWFGDYPLIAVWVNLACVFCSLIGFFLISKYGLHRQTAHLLTFAIYLSSAGIATISGGIHSSSIVWQVFVPVISITMAGFYAGLRWGGISFVTVLAFYIIDGTELLRRITGFEVTTVDLLIDLSGLILAVSIAIWYSDNLKSRSLTQLEEARAKLDFMASIDSLTNIFNRRHFLKLSERLIKRINASQGFASFLMFDLDHFKKINDAYGHLIGDEILQGVVQTCLANLRPDDLLARFGGEEFVILLPDTKQKDAKIIAERLRHLIAEVPIVTESGPIHTSISIGVASMGYNGNEMTVDQLLSRADQAMYRAKQMGRNRVIVWEENDFQTT